ncbi:MAG: Iron-sulfur clusters incorporation protein [Caeruleum heppii]|nr:MAG: Iron-sulfur clusters incorporation protein [Caeruleum heppii]
MLLTRSKPPYICVRCSFRRSFSVTGPTRSRSSPTPKPPPSGAAPLTNRRLIALHGADAAHFLQGLTTNNVETGRRTGFYSAFLTAQGRVLNDVFIYPTSHASSWTSTIPSNLSTSDPGFLIEVDASEATKLLAHIKRYKLRSKFAVRLVDEGEWNVWSTWDDSGKEKEWTAHSYPDTRAKETPSNPTSPPSLPTNHIGCPDPRAPGMGHRIILPASQTPSTLSLAPLESYTHRRILHGVPEGQAEILRDISLPLESNLDYMHGVDFRKGCYVGQELTIRTRHTGVVRKRIVPVRVYAVDDEETPTSLTDHPSSSSDRSPDLPPSGTPVHKPTDPKKRSVGKFLAGIHDVGLALCRLESMTALKLPGSSTAGSVRRRRDGGGEEGDGGEGGRRFVGEWVEGGQDDGGGGGKGDGSGKEEERRQVGIKAFVPGWWPGDLSG